MILNIRTGPNRRPAALDPVRSLQRLGQRFTENLPWDNSIQLLKRVTHRGQPIKTIIDVPEPDLSSHVSSPRRSMHTVNQNLADLGRFFEVSSFIDSVWSH